MGAVCRQRLRGNLPHITGAYNPSRLGANQHPPGALKEADELILNLD